MTYIDHLHEETKMLSVHDHLYLISSQYLARALQPHKSSHMVIYFPQSLDLRGLASAWAFSLINGNNMRFYIFCIMDTKQNYINFYTILEWKLIICLVSKMSWNHLWAHQDRRFLHNLPVDDILFCPKSHYDYLMGLSQTQYCLYIKYINMFLLWNVRILLFSVFNKIYHS